MPARQKQIWAVLRRGDSPARLSYSLAATFLGRMCLSGDWAELPEISRAFVRTATQLYRDVAPVIRDGVFRTQRVTSESYQHPTGHQVVTIRDAAHQQLVIVWHRFAKSAPDFSALLPAHREEGAWSVAAELGSGSCSPTLSSTEVRWHSPREWDGGVLWLVYHRK